MADGMKRQPLIVILTIVAITALDIFPCVASQCFDEVVLLLGDTAKVAPIDSVGKTSALSLQPSARKPFLPTRRRIDREINKIQYVYKGEMALGLAVSYGTMSSDDTDFMLLIDNIDLEGSIFTVNPSFGYFVKNNLCLGVRFGYTQADGQLNSAALDLGEINDVNMSFSNIRFTNRTISLGAFMRSYAGIDTKGHFGLFGEMELAAKSGSSEFSYESDGQLKHTKSDNRQFKLSFSAGVAVYLFPNVCSSLSFGLGGIQVNNITQKDREGNIIGSRKASKMLFRLNLADIRIGVNIFL